ncbi:MAG: hypothetical protein ACE5K9_02040 [Candidatus Methylomirabilales bacterium]
MREVLTKNGEQESFRSPFLPNFIALAVLGGIIGYTLIWLDSGPDLDPIGLLIAGAAVLVVSAYGTSQLVSKFLVYVTPVGIWSYDIWGRYHFVEWSAVSSASRLNFVVVGYVALRSTSGGPALFVPTNLVGSDRFRQRVLELAGRGHPLTRALLQGAP